MKIFRVPTKRKTKLSAAQTARIVLLNIHTQPPPTAGSSEERQASRAGSVWVLQKRLEISNGLSRRAEIDSWDVSFPCGGHLSGGPLQARVPESGGLMVGWGSHGPKYVGLAGRLLGGVIRKRSNIETLCGTRWCLVAPDGMEGDTDPERQEQKAMKRLGRARSAVIGGAVL